MMDNDTFLINVQAGGFKLPLRIARKDEEIYRKAEKLFSKYLEKYQQKYHQRANEEILTLVAYQFAVLLIKQEMRQDVSPVIEKLISLNKEIENCLSRK
ncbi:MAG TPA: cell division protein ZapA [Paludibacteraceae bacterium]|nr:cell division protein ZapA [Paludibacteraceae bacterium]